MDWSQHSIPPMRLEPRFGDRVVPAFCERPKSIWAMIADAVARNPDGEALVCGDRRMTWREVARQSAQIAAGLQKLGLKRGDRVAVLLGNRIEFVLTMFGAAHAGLVTVLLSTRQQKPEIAYVLTDCGARLLIHEAALADRLPDARDVPDVTHRIAVDDDARVSRFSELAENAPLACAGRGRRRRHRDDPLHLGHHGAAEGRDAGALQRHPFGDGVRIVPEADRGGSLDRRRAARACHRRGRQHHDHGPLRRRADHHGRIQGRGISEDGGARARHLHRDGAGDVQSLPAAAGFRQLRSVELADRRLRRRADADRHHRKAGRQDSRTETGELLRRDRDHVALDHDARRTDRQPHRQCRPAVSGRADRRHGCRRP